MAVKQKIYGPIEYIQIEVNYSNKYIKACFNRNMGITYTSH
jgi:hypothetical protein